MTGTVYRNFTIRAWSASAGQVNVQVWGATPGEQGATDPETVPFNPDLFLVKRDGSSLDLLETIRRRPVPDDVLYELGTILAGIILPPRILENFDNSLRVATGRGERLRLRLMLQVPELKSLPWEYLYRAPAPGVRAASGFLALQQDISIVRHEAIGGPEPPTPQGGSYRMVAAFSSPHGQPVLDLASDRAAIEAALSAPPHGVTITPCWVKPTTPDSLAAALKTKCDMFHFSGHGYFFDGKGSLILDGPDQQGVTYEADKLGQLLKNAKTKVAILSACETAERSSDNSYTGVAAALVLGGLAAVVASQFRLRDTSALAVAKLLYASLVSGEAIDDGVYQARQKMFQTAGLTDRDWGALVLYLRVEDGVVFPRGQHDGAKPSAPRIKAPPLKGQLIGRDDQFAQFAQRLSQGTKLFFHGKFGVGKTSLATALFEQAASGGHGPGYVWRQVGKTSPERALESLATAFTGQQISKADGLAAKVDAFRSLLASFPGMLIGLDEVPDAKVARAILDATTGCTVVMNGIKKLGLGGTAEEIKIEPLAPDDAQKLFLALSNFSASTMSKKDLDRVGKICKRMQFLPLAIRLAALRCAEGESLETLWSRLEQAPSTIPDEDVHLLLQASYDELASSPCAQRLLVRIACFPALEAPLDAMRTNEDAVEFFQAKDKLVSLGLLDAAGTDRVSQHPLLNPKENPAVDKDLVKSEREFAEGWIENYASAHRRDFPMLLKEHDNLLGLVNANALGKRWDRAIGLMRNLFDYLRVRGLWLEAFEQIDRCLRNEQYLTDANRGWALLHRAILHTLLGHYDKALGDIKRAEERFDYDQDQVNYGRARYRRGVVHILTGELQLACGELQEAIGAMAIKAEEAGADFAGAYARLGAVLAQQGRRAEAKTAFERALRLAEQIDDLEEQARAYLGMGAMNQAADPDQALVYFDKALGLADRMGDELNHASIVHMIGYQHYHAGRYDEAHERFRQALETCRRFGYQRGIAKGLLAMGNSALAKKLYPEARQHYGEAIALNKSLGQLGAAAYAVYQSAIVAHREGRLDDAERDYNEAGDYARKEKDRVLEAAVLAQLAKLLLDQGDRKAAERNARKALELAHDLEDQLTRVTAAYTLGLLQDTSGQDDNAHETKVAAGHARATIKGVQDEIATLEKISEAIVSVSFGEETHTSTDIDRGSPRINFPDRIIGDSIDLTYSDREPGGFGRGGGGSDDDSGGGFGGGFTGGNF